MADEHFSMDGVGPQGGSIGMTFGVAGAASTVVGLAADFAQPFGPIALYILLFAGGFTALIALFYLLIRYLRPKLRSPFVFLGVLTLVAGIMVLFQQMAGAEGDDRGALAVLVKPLAQLQDDMGLVKKDIAAIKKSTQRTAIATERTAKAVEKVAKGIETIGKLGGLVANPKSVVDHYNNALVYERRGDALSARKMYEKAIGLGAGAIDLHQRYAAMLKAQEGLLGAREVYSELARAKPDNKAIALTRAVLQPTLTREKALRALVDGADPYGPAWFEIAKLYSLDRLGQQSLSDKRAEKAALEAFEKADKAGRIYKHFLRKEIIEKWRTTVAARIAPYRTSAVDISPVTIAATPSNSTWTIAINIAEPVRAIRYRVDGGDTKSTGHTNFVNQATGAKQPRTFFQVPLSVAKAGIEIWYDDVRGKARGPFRKDFDAATAHVKHTKNILETLTPKWVSGRDFNGKFLVYFSHIVSYKCGIKEIAYGVNTKIPDQTWPVPACDLKNPYGIGPNSRLYETFPQKIGFMSVRLTYTDGTTSPIKEFKF